MNVGVQFSNMTSEDGSYTLDTSFFGVNALEGDSIFMFEGGVWNLSQADKLDDASGWVFYPANGDTEEIVSTIKVSKGDLLYFRPYDKSATAQVPVSGQVAATGKQSITFTKTKEDWFFTLCNPFPIDTTWGDLNTFTKENDSIFAFDGKVWNLDQYDRLADGEGWVFYPADGSDEEIITDETAVAIPAGSAAYYRPVETVTWTVTL